MTKQDIINYVTETPQNTNPAILNTMLDQLSSGDGGGGESGDFSTAEVTIINNSQVDSLSNCPNCWESNTLPVENFPPVVNSTALIATENTKIIYAPLYKGACFWTPTEISLSDIVLNGDISNFMNFGLLITGDCTITIS